MHKKQTDEVVAVRCDLDIKSWWLHRTAEVATQEMCKL